MTERDEEMIRGTVQSIVFQNAENGYTVLRLRTEGVNSLDLRPLEEQYADPRRTNRVSRAVWSIEDIPLPFVKDPNYNSKKEPEK